MSVDISSLPPWKRELLEKRRKHEEEDRRKKEIQEDRLSQMPSWKRDIILKKQQQKNSLVFIGKSAEHSPRSDVSNGDISASRSVDHEGYIDESDELDKTVLNHSQIDAEIDSKTVEEHLIPIQQNPWVLTEKHWKRSKPHSRYSHREESENEGYINYVDHSSVTYHNDTCETDGHLDSRGIVHHDTDEDIFTEPEEEVQYGKGFVDKLRQKFSHLSSSKDKKRPHSIAVTGINLSPKHSRSAENILDEVSKPMTRSISTSDDVDYFVKASIFSPPKARSMDNILSDKPSRGHHYHENERKSRDIPRPARPVSNSPTVKEICSPIPQDERETDETFAVKKGIKIRSSELYVEELPRPNIVSSTRTLFEASGLKDDVHKQELDSSEHSSRLINDNDYMHTDTVTNGIQRDALANHLDSDNSRKSSNKVTGVSSSGPTEDTLQSVRSTGKVWYSSGTESQEGSNKSHEYTPLQTHSHSVVGSRQPGGSRSPRTTVTADNQRANLASHYGLQVHSNSPNAVEPSNIISQKNQRNADLSSSTLEQPRKDSSFSDSSKTGSSSSSKKRPAPEPPQQEEHSRKTGFIDLDTTADSVALLDSSAKSDRTKLHLDFSSHNENIADVATASSPSYRDLYFATTKENKSSSPFDLSGTEESVVDEDDEHLLQKPSHTTAQTVRSATKLSDSTDSGVGSEGTNTHSTPSGATTASSSVSVTEKHSMSTASASGNVNRAPTAAAENKRPTPPNSLPENKKNIPVSLGVNIADINAKNKELSKDISDNKRSKRQASQGPGSLLIRPASNLVTGAQTVNHQYLQLNRYNDVKTGTFEPAKKTSNYRDVPVTNIDDMLDEILVTNIDDMGFSPDLSPRSSEIDSDTLRRQAAKKYEFVGAEVSLGRSMLVRSRTKKLHIHFNEAATSTYEYPSEQSLLDEMPPEPGDFDYQDLSASAAAEATLDSPSEELLPAVGASLRSTPGISPAAGAGGGLANYNPRFTVDYELGMDIPRDAEKNGAAASTAANDAKEESEVQIKPADGDDTYSWSNTASSDMLF